MSRAKGKGEAPLIPATQEAQALGAFLRGIADRAESDPTFAATLTHVAQESGVTRLVGGAPVRRQANQQEAPSATAKAKGRAAKAHQPQATAAQPTSTSPSTPLSTTEPPDPFRLMRDQGEEALRAALTALDLTALRQIVRSHRLDPARISARWTTPERIIALIVDQVRARLNHGRSFERV
ncbi:MAG: hypothetical protein ABI068_18070 [Ktedonobacterales bacterium]